MITILKDTNINFVGQYKWTTWLSVVLVVLSFYGIFTRMNYGVDFRGGAEIQVKFKQAVDMDLLRQAATGAGLTGVSVQTIGEAQDFEFLLKVLAEEKDLNRITNTLSTTLSSQFADAGAEVRKVDIVGPKAGESLRLSGLLAMFWAIVAIVVYIALRFDLKYSPGAITSLVHDVILMLGLFAWTGLEFSLQIVAAILAVVGYSVNDTVIVYDRLRENEAKNPDLSVAKHVNRAVNETLSRTVLTTGTTLLVSFTMLLIGGAAIKDFFFAITTGIIIGTYSSIYVAAPTVILTDRWKGKKTNADADLTAKQIGQETVNRS